MDLNSRRGGSVRFLPQILIAAVWKWDFGARFFPVVLSLSRAWHQPACSTGMQRLSKCLNEIPAFDLINTVWFPMRLKPRQREQILSSVLLSFATDLQSD